MLKKHTQPFSAPQALSSALAAAEAPKEQPRAVPTTESLVTVLEQALQSLDDALLEECLAVSDEQVVDATVERLSALRVLPLLLHLADKVERRPSRGLALCVWMRAILVRHAGFLLSVPNLHLKLAGLHQILDSRTAIFPKLLSLNGRLELALSQISSHDASEGAAAPHAFYDEEVEEAVARAGNST